jgi:hypothetical protein
MAKLSQTGQGQQALRVRSTSRPARRNFASLRFSKDELKGFVGPVQRLAAETKRVHVPFKNCHGDQAQRNPK